jgi:hypothetical protein
VLARKGACAAAVGEIERGPEDLVAVRPVSCALHGGAEVG